MSNNFQGVPHAHPVGSNIAANTGAVLYEDDKAGKSLSGGANPTTNYQTNASGVPQGTQPFPGTAQSHLGTQTTQGLPNYQSAGTSSLGTSTPAVTDVGLNTGGQSLSEKVKATNAQPSTGTGIGTTTSSAPGTAGAGSAPPTGTVYEQATRSAQIAANKAQELSQPVQPYIQKVQETVGPYVQNAVEATSPYVQQAREVAQPYVEKASALAAQGIQVTAAELDKRGVNAETTQQKLADVGQSLKDYGTVGQARANEYIQQAAHQVQNLSADKENKNIVATIFGTIALIWLAFGFSITALLALGIAGTIAAILSRYSRSTVGNRASNSIGGNSIGGASRPRTAPGVETHYPNPAHPDNSLNN